ncbi:hypothetical protein UlMin_033883 [Ulmus minor]
MGTYLGPDVTSDSPRRSASQRVREGYKSTDLGASYVSVSLLENLYYYVLRKANPSLVLRPTMLHRYLKGSICRSNFTNMFPLNLHDQIWYPATFRIVKGIVLLDNPVTSHLEEKDIGKFKSLSCADSFKLDMDEFIRYDHEYRNCSSNCVETFKGDSSNGNGDSSSKFLRKYKRRCDSKPMPMPMPGFPSTVCVQGEDPGRACVSNGPATVPFPIQSMEKWTLDASIILSGTAGKGKSVPPIGNVDVGVNKVAYYFRVALPGVRKDYCQFNCQIEPEGKVHIRGLTNGGKTIKKPSRVFLMKFQQLCPPGPFSLSFSLPGPVDPRLFAPNFRCDGVFEGVVIKLSSK